MHLVCRHGLHSTGKARTADQRLLESLPRTVGDTRRWHPGAVDLLEPAATDHGTGCTSDRNGPSLAERDVK